MFRPSERLLDDDSQKLTEFISGESRVANDSTHRKRIHRIMPGDGEDSRSVRHHNVLPLPHHPEASFL